MSSLPSFGDLQRGAQERARAARFCRVQSEGTISLGDVELTRFAMDGVVDFETSMTSLAVTLRTAHVKGRPDATLEAAPDGALFEVRQLDVIFQNSVGFVRPTNGEDRRWRAGGQQITQMARNQLAVVETGLVTIEGDPVEVDGETYRSFSCISEGVLGDGPASQNGLSLLLDSEGRMRRMTATSTQRVANGVTLSTFRTTEFSNYGEAVDLQLPSEAEIDTSLDGDSLLF